MKVGILAAGEGARLRAGGWPMPKPLVPVRGIPLVGHVLQALVPLDAEEIVCLVNDRGKAVADYARRAYAHLPLTFVQRQTAHSFESFQCLCRYLHGSPFLVTTVDTLMAPTVLSQFLAAARQQAQFDMMLAVTTFIDDEKPLYVQLDEAQRIRQLGAAAAGSVYVTSGLYYCTPRVSALCVAGPPGHFRALREFLVWLLQRGYWLQGYQATKMIDVDRPQDIAVAERFLCELDGTTGNPQDRRQGGR